jgi:hypothetical protein
MIEGKKSRVKANDPHSPSTIPSICSKTPVKLGNANINAAHVCISLININDNRAFMTIEPEGLRVHKTPLNKL